MMKVIVTGAAGRMGSAVCSLDGICVVGAIDPSLEITHISDYDGVSDGIIDFSHHCAAEEICEYAVRRNLPVVFATTGHTPDEIGIIEECARHVPVFMSANMSIGIAALCDLARRAAVMFPKADIEIVECHHNRKLDAPSGTALILADEIAEARGGADFVYGRAGQSARREGEIGIHALRMGNIVGEHEVIISTDTERLTLKHEAFDRTLFAQGALRALEFIATRPPRLYSMKDMVALYEN